MFGATEALFLRCSDQLAINDERRRRVTMEGVETEDNQRGALLIFLLSIELLQLVQLGIYNKPIPETLRKVKNKPGQAIHETQPRKVTIEPVKKSSQELWRVSIDVTFQQPTSCCLPGDSN